MIPPRSPYGLIQEDLWPNEFKILVACMLLNCTTRKQVEKVVPTLFRLWPDATAMAAADPQKLSEVIAPLGFKNRRASNLIKMSKHYLAKDWKHVKELPGIGDYAAGAWEIFCRQSIPQACPPDHALKYYYDWRKLHAEDSEGKKRVCASPSEAQTQS